MNKKAIAVIVVVVVVVLVIVIARGCGGEAASTPAAGGAVTVPAGGAAAGAQPEAQGRQMTNEELAQLAASVPKDLWSKLPEWQRTQLEAWAAAQGQ